MGKRNPIAKAVQQLRPRVIPSKKDWSRDPLNFAGHDDYEVVAREIEQEVLDEEITELTADDIDELVEAAKAHDPGARKVDFDGPMDKLRRRFHDGT